MMERQPGSKCIQSYATGKSIKGKNIIPQLSSTIKFTLLRKNTTREKGGNCAALTSHTTATIIPQNTHNNQPVFFPVMDVAL